LIPLQNDLIENFSCFISVIGGFYLFYPLFLFPFSSSQYQQTVSNKSFIINLLNNSIMEKFIKVKNNGINFVPVAIQSVLNIYSVPEKKKQGK